MGADSFAALSRWHRSAEIPFAAALIVASRPGEPLIGPPVALPAGCTLHAVPASDRMVSGIDVRAFEFQNPLGERASLYVLPDLHVEISASEIRAHLREAASGSSAADLLPAAVADYIRSHGLYR